jgi:putative pyrroloquinoline-quinone-binding quinoprotein
MIRRSLLAFVIVAAALAAPAAAPNESWPQFRGPSAGVAENDPALPESWSATSNVAWTAGVPGTGWSSPVVWGDHVFLTSVINTGAAEAPKPGLYLFGERPASRSKPLGPFKTRNGWGTAASPVLHRDRVYIVNDNDEQSFLAAYDKRTGAEAWRVKRDEGTNWATNSKIFALSEDGDTYVIQAGPAFKVLGKNPLGEMALATPAISRGSLIIRTASKLYRVGSPRS